MIYVECEQGTPEWHAARAGVITASNFATACDKLKSGQPSKACIQYAARVAIERISGEPADDGFESWQMRRGREQEQFGRIEYMARTGLIVNQAGVCLTEDRLFGYSTDGFIGTDGGMEIKSLVAAEKLIALWQTGDLSEFKHQIQGGLWITGRKWCDFVLWAPQLAACGKDLLVIRCERDEDFIASMEMELLAFSRVVAENEALMRMPKAA